MQIKFFSNFFLFFIWNVISVRTIITTQNLKLHFVPSDQAVICERCHHLSGLKHEPFILICVAWETNQSCSQSSPGRFFVFYIATLSRLLTGFSCDLGAPPIPRPRLASSNPLDVHVFFEGLVWIVYSTSSSIVLHTVFPG